MLGTVFTPSVEVLGSKKAGCEGDAGARVVGRAHPCDDR